MMYDFSVFENASVTILTCLFGNRYKHLPRADVLNRGSGNQLYQLIWELVRSADAQAPPQRCWVRHWGWALLSVSRSPLGDSDHTQVGELLPSGGWFPAE